MTIDNVVERFFAANSSLFDDCGNSPTNTSEILKNYIDPNSKTSSNGLIFSLKNKYNDYKEKFGELPIEKINSFDRDLNNWLKGEEDMDVLRGSLISLIFILKFTSKEPEKFTVKNANELLQKFGQHKLHYGGDVPESIIYYCLLNSGHPYSHALKMNSTIEELLKDETIDIPLKESPSYSQRTVAIAKDFGFSKTPDEFFDEITVSKDFFNSIQAKADKSFSKKDIDAICKILINEKYMNIKSNRTFALVHKTIENATKKSEENNKKSKKITGTSFSSFFNKEKGIGTWANALSKFKTGYESSKITPQPTRDFILLISMLSWSIMEVQISLKDYTNEFLDKCQYPYLDEKTLPDIFINEWNNFKIKEGKLYYLDKMVLCKDINKKSTIYDAMQIVINKYAESYKSQYNSQLIDDFFQLQNSKMFFEF